MPRWLSGESDGLEKARVRVRTLGTVNFNSIVRIPGGTHRNHTERTGMLETQSEVVGEFRSSAGKSGSIIKDESK